MKTQTNVYEQSARAKKVDAILDELARLQRNTGGAPHKRDTFLPFVRAMTRDQRAAVEYLADVRRCSEETWAQVMETFERRCV